MKMAIETNEEEGDLERKWHRQLPGVQFHIAWVVEEKFNRKEGSLITTNAFSERLAKGFVGTRLSGSVSNPRMGNLVGSLTKPHTVGRTMAKLGTISIGKELKESSRGH
ncbi:hypothetical protein FNV43_RR00155 [Rhamnella rubrinervis]|uniref:Uncharacterized protein n=1 Tax=Rhamnella rubrinervis TaxID=2594499 RepID=A0A8K0MRM8_9ROSA|nr:hypothetical protein FNV43_RR00155 [Rhamnella rubrinervis]